MTVTMTIRLTQEEKELFKKHAAAKNAPLSEMVRAAVIEQIEDELDIKDYHEAMAEFKRNPITHTHEEVFGKIESVV